jgi:hypothetical protein
MQILKIRDTDNPQFMNTPLNDTTTDKSGVQLLNAFFVVLLLLAATSTNAFGYTLMGSNVRWTSFPVSYYINTLGCSGITNGSDFLAIQSAFQTWQNVKTASVSLSYQGVTDIQSAAYDGVNLISFQDLDTPFSTGTIAMTIPTWNNNGVMLDADLVFNPTLSFATGGDPTPDNPQTFDVQAVATHEIGHFLGLDHTAIVSATMNPYAAPDDFFPRVLKNDDILGISSLYPSSSFLSSTGAVSGLVLLNGNPMLGAHVVAVDANGNATASALTASDGSYRIAGLPPGNYSLYAEPLDGPVTQDNFTGGDTGGSGGFGASFNTNFSTTFYGDTLIASSRKLLTISAGKELNNSTIHVAAAPALPFTLMEPGMGIFAEVGASGTWNGISGDGIESGVSFSLLDPLIRLTNPVFPSSGTANVKVSIDPSDKPGLKTLFASKTGGLTAISGALIIMDPWPTLDSTTPISPASGVAKGGTRVTITGSNFVNGTGVFLGGLPLTDISLKSSTALEGTTPANGGGNAGLLVVSPEGGWTEQPAAFSYVWPAISISGISPSSGPPSTVVTITGTNFDKSPVNNQVQFNGVQATVVSASPTQLVVVVPFGASSGPIMVTTFDQSASGGSFTVTAPLLSSNLASTQFDYVDTSPSAGGTQLSFPLATPTTNDLALPVTLPFNFTLFTSTFLQGSKVYVTTNGWLAIGSPVSTDRAEWQNASLPASEVTHPQDQSTGVIPGNLIAPFFADLAQAASGSGVFTRVLGTAPNRQFVVEWQNSTIVDASDPQGGFLNSNMTFQAILYEGSNDIAFQYQTLEGPHSNGDSATVGIQNAARNQAVQFSYNQPSLHAGLTVVFRFNPQNGTYQLLGNELRQSIPFVTDAAQFRTNLGLSNPSSQAATATLTLYDATGNVLGSQTDTIPAHGLHQHNNVVRYLVGSDPNTIRNQSGAVVVTSDQPVIAYATQIDNQTNDPSLLVGNAHGGADLVIPSTTSVGKFRSTLSLQNVGGGTTNVTLRLRNTSGAIVKESSPFVLPANGYYSVDNLHAILGVNGVYGPLEIHATDSVPLVATSRVLAVNTRTSGFFNAIDPAEAARTGIVPITLNNIAFRTNLGIDNWSDSVADVTVSFVGADGTTLATTTVQVPARGLFQQNVNQFFSNVPGLANALGYIKLNSTQLITGYTTLIDNSSDDPSIAASVTGGAPHVWVPSSTNINPFRSSLMVINAGNNAAASVNVVVRDTSGNIIGQEDGRVIPPNGFFSVDDLLTSLNITSNYGPVEITSTDSAPLVVVSRGYSPNDHTSGFFQGQTLQ